MNNGIRGLLIALDRNWRESKREEERIREKKETEEGCRSKNRRR